MLLIDSNVFIYARSKHPFGSVCQRMIARAADHPEWVVPLLVLLELTHYYGDAGTYARLVLDAFTSVETLVGDLEWAAAHCLDHTDLNDHVLLASAHRLGARGVVSYDRFFQWQQHFPGIRAMTPEQAG